MRKLGTFAIVLTLAIMSMPSAIADAGSRPFAGSASGMVTFPLGTDCQNYGGANVRTDSDAIGQARHLGRTVLDAQHCTPEPGTNTVAGDITLIAANGDEVYLDYQGVNGQPDPDTLILVSDLEYRITGGTGRFAHASGSGTMTAFVRFEGFGVPEWPVTWVWEGTISY